MSLEAVQPQDALSLGEVYCKAWRTAYAGLVPQDFLDALTPKHCAPLPTQIVAADSFVFKQDGRIVGLVNFGACRDELDGRTGEIRSIYVLPDCWNLGIGRQLFLAAKDALQKQGYVRWIVWTLVDNLRARRFYEKLGMTNTARTRRMELGGRDLLEVQSAGD